ncbi:hypothetical protein MYRNA_219 [Mycobacterium phage Myrna]|uniref:Uncharacterized protein n=1 Tax=Mycobacterium phage Myrna TaxID=546805 RepID=B5LJI9_9CAUD|nr:gp219 [Mycobacterium phage Myrna]ACH62186.1 hypothetical protein MYRNA_219 [Mycobacterium phage Myrna]
MPVKNEEWEVPVLPGLPAAGAGKRYNYLTSNPSPAEACERIAAALGGTLLVRTADLDLKALRETGKLPEKIAYSVDVTRFYDEISTIDDGNGGRRPKLPGSGMGMPTWAELDEWYEEKGYQYNRRHKIDHDEWKRGEEREQLLAKFRSVLPSEESDEARLRKIADTLDLDVRPKAEAPQTGVEAVKGLWGLTLKSTAIVASKLAAEGKEAAKAKWAKARRT